ncbi:MAG: hypothetical protein ACOX6T_26740 [Myxococcales bacterium]|jgi:hypothetical protein
MIPRPLLNAEALTRADDEMAFSCTCNGDPCPLCGVAEASPYCSLHNGEYLMRAIEERTGEVKDEEIEARASELLDEMELDDLLADRSFNDLMGYLTREYPESLREWINEHVEVGMEKLGQNDFSPYIREVRGL